MRVDEFDYFLPPELIAQQPSEKRECSKMMVLNRQNQEIYHRNFFDILDYIKPNDLLVLNNTRVIQARLFGTKETGAKIEIFLIKSISETLWQCFLRPQKRIKAGIKIKLKDNSSIKVVERTLNGQWLIETPSEFNKIIQKTGTMPLPPYIKRWDENIHEAQDRERYQTVYARIPGAVAAPTAGLHFSPDIIDKIKKHNIKIAEITLHVGPGTFKPVKCEKVQDHIMHEEFYSVSEEAASTINNHKAESKRIITVGTTSIRTLETIANLNNGQMKACSGWSNIFIYPGYNFKIVDACLTNFHLPKSTLIMLVSALAGKEFILKSYQEAIKNNYRFYSYGDCMLII